MRRVPRREIRTGEECFSGKRNNKNQDIDVEKEWGRRGAMGNSKQISMTNYSKK